MQNELQPQVDTLVKENADLKAQFNVLANIVFKEYANKGYGFGQSVKDFEKDVNMEYYKSKNERMLPDEKYAGFWAILEDAAHKRKTANIS